MAYGQNAPGFDPLTQITNSDVLYSCLQHPGVLGDRGDHAVEFAVERIIDLGLVVKEVDRAPGIIGSRSNIRVPVTVTHAVMGFTSTT